jgi:hypothetical protein
MCNLNGFDTLPLRQSGVKPVKLSGAHAPGCSSAAVRRRRPLKSAAAEAAAGPSEASDRGCDLRTCEIKFNLTGTYQSLQLSPFPHYPHPSLPPALPPFPIPLPLPLPHPSPDILSITALEVDESSRGMSNGRVQYISMLHCSCSHFPRAAMDRRPLVVSACPTALEFHRRRGCRAAFAVKNRFEVHIHAANACHHRRAAGGGRRAAASVTSRVARRRVASGPPGAATPLRAEARRVQGLWRSLTKSRRAAVYMTAALGEMKSATKALASSVMRRRSRGLAA